MKDAFNDTPEAIVQDMLDAMGVDDCNLNSRGLFEERIRRYGHNRAKAAIASMGSVASKNTWDKDYPHRGDCNGHLPDCSCVFRGEISDVTCNHPDCPHWGTIKVETPKPVSVEECAERIYASDLIHAPMPKCRSVSKAILDAAGVKYHD